MNHAFETLHDGNLCIYCGEPESQHGVSDLATTDAEANTGVTNPPKSKEKL